MSNVVNQRQREKAAYSALRVCPSHVAGTLDGKTENELLNNNTHVSKNTRIRYRRKSLIAAYVISLLVSISSVRTSYQTRRIIGIPCCFARYCVEASQQSLP